MMEKSGDMRNHFDTIPGRDGQSERIAVSY